MARRSVRGIGRRAPSARLCRKRKNMQMSTRCAVRVALWLAFGSSACQLRGQSCSPDLDDTGVRPHTPSVVRSGVLSAKAGQAALLCPGGEHVYRIDPLPAGTLLVVELRASEGERSLDMILTSTSARSGLRAARSGDSLEIGAPSDGGPYVLSVRSLAAPIAGDSVGQRYQLMLTVLPEPTNDCCTSSSLAGCRDEAVAFCVCQLDTGCCSDSYDALCVIEAVGSCGLACGVAGRGMPGCAAIGPAASIGCETGEDMERCVCDIDPYCCGVQFDENCSRLARHRCGGAEGISD